MNRLTLAQTLAKEMGISGTGPSTTLSQTGDYGRIVRWIDEAWLELQGLHSNWRFLWDQFSFETTADQSDYTPASGVNRYDTKSIKCYKTADGVTKEYRLTYVPYHLWREKYDVGSTSTGKPGVFTILPDDQIRIGPLTPDAAYTITGDYWKNPTEFSADADEPDLRTHHHMIIVWAAAIKYARYEEAGDVFAMATSEYERMLHILRRQELPKHTLRLTPLA